MAEKKKKSTGGQSADTFAINEGVRGIQARPHMYLGEAGPSMVYRCIKEEVDNCLDEAMAGRNDWVEIYYDSTTREFIVADKAGGIPVDFKKRDNGEKISILTAAFTIAHAGGKFNDAAYKVSAGTHGVGVTAVNAVSDFLEVWTKRDGQIWSQRFEGGFPVEAKPKKVKSLPKHISECLTSKGYGTVIHNRLNQGIVSTDAKNGKLPKGGEVAHPDLANVVSWIESISELNPGLTLVLTVRNAKGVKSKTFVNKRTLAQTLDEIVSDCLGEEESRRSKPVLFKNDYVTALLQWTTLPHQMLRSSVNNSPTVDGGTHVRGLIDALAEAVKPYENSKHLDKKKRKYSSDDLLFGLVGIFDWRMHGAQYHSQVKDKLVSKVQDEVKAMLLPEIQKHFAANKTLPKAILDRAVQVEASRESMQKTLRSMTDAKRNARVGGTPACLHTASTKDDTQREMFVVEGDSAGGSAKNARNPVTQEVFKAGGKPANALTSPLDKVIGNPTVSDFLVSLGVDFKEFDEQIKKRVPNPTFSVDKLRVQRLYLLADADVDGYHINALFLATIWTLIPDLIRQGRVYVVDAPLFNVIHKGKHYGGRTKEEVIAKAPKEVKATAIQRAKGWGEVPVPVMEVIAFDSTTRNVLRVLPFDTAEGQQWYYRVVGDDASARRQLLGFKG